MNQNAEQIARDKIDAELASAGWAVQKKTEINLGARLGVAVREYHTDVGPADYVLFVDKKPVGIIEAKRAEEGLHLTQMEDQAEGYAKSKLKHLNNDPLPFVYESTGEITRFTDLRDPKPRSRPVFMFHKPEALHDLLKEERTLRSRLLELPGLPAEGLRDCQIAAIGNLEKSFKASKPRALIQMATGSGKTFTAITFIYRLLKYAGAKRVLFLVDTKNLGEQAEQEFMAFLPNDDNRKFAELYGVHRMKSSSIPTDNQVYISTIQRLYSLLKGVELEEGAEEENPNEKLWQAKEPVPVAYNAKVPVEFFDFIVIDECHRSIYNLWKQVLDYFDAFQVGLTATPDNRTYGYFNQNVVSDYGFEEAVADGVLVPYNVYTIETEITKRGSAIWKGEYIDRREKLSRRKRWEQLDEDIEYSGKQLDSDIVNPSQIRLIVKTFKEHLPEMFPDRTAQDGSYEVPKTLIFAKTDSHADDIINIVREEFGEENRFCKKVTYRADDAKGVLADFRNNYYPRIAVTVDMIATGTDVKPLEILFFMRDVKSRNYFEQMKGRGTRTIPVDDLRKVTPSAKYTKDHFVIVDAIGVTKSLKTDSRPLERKPGAALKDLLSAVAVGAREEDLFTTLANRLARLDKQLTEKEKEQFETKAQGRAISDVVKGLLSAYNPDTLEALKQEAEKANPRASADAIEKAVQEKHGRVLDEAAAVFTGDLNAFIENVRRTHEQIIDEVNRDRLVGASWDKDNIDQANALVHDFAAWLEVHRDEITALQIFYSQPFRRRELTFAMIKEVMEKLKTEKPALAPMRVWRAYEQIEKTSGTPKNDLIALVSLIRRVTKADQALTSYDKTVDKNFQDWAFQKQAGPLKFTEEQMQWLRMIKDYVAASFHIEKDDFELDPFNAKGGLGKMWQLFGDKTDEILSELNAALVA
jgi:type I restriction enzyme R subunit